MSHERLNCVCARWYNTDMGPIPSEGGARSAWRAGLSVALCLSILGMADAAGQGAVRRAPRCVVSRVGFSVLHTSRVRAAALPLAFL